MRRITLIVWMLVAATASAQQIDLKSLDRFGAKAKEKTEINMDEPMVKTAEGFLSEEKPGEAGVKKSVAGLKGFYLRVFEFEDKDAYKMEDLKPLLDQLKAPNWVSFLRAQERSGLTEIWMLRTKGEDDGILLIAAEGRELTVINAIGVTRLHDLSSLGKFGELAARQEKPQPDKAPGSQKKDD